MRFEKGKKAAIIQYLLEKLDAGDPELIRSVEDAFSINQSTVHAYLKELLAEGVIRRVKRGTYQLVTTTRTYVFSRAAGQLSEEQVIYNEYLRPHFSAFPQNVRSCWEYILGEMINNVIDHSQSEEMLVLIRQDHLQTGVLISDSGVGIFRKIADYFHFDALEDAIAELFKGKLTTDPAHHSGEGIFFSSRLADRFTILSDGRLFTNDRYENAHLFDISDDPPGTLVMIGLSNFSKKQPAEVFDRYAPVDGGFTKTRLPLKNIFDAAPVSRSQAKRICQRLELFEEVTLDFDGLEWMGQGFAHQIFVVFQNDHPSVLLRPVNMSEGVAKMYRHVLSGSPAPPRE